MVAKPLTPSALLKEMQSSNRSFGVRLDPIISFTGPGSYYLNKLKNHLYISCPIRVYCEGYSIFDSEFRTLFVKAAHTRLNGGDAAKDLAKDLDVEIRTLLQLAVDSGLTLEFEIPGRQRSKLKDPDLIMGALNKWCGEVAIERQELVRQSALYHEKKAQRLAQKSASAATRSASAASLTPPPAPKAEILAPAVKTPSPPATQKNKNPKLDPDDGKAIVKRTMGEVDLTAAMTPLNAALMGWKVNKNGRYINPKTNKPAIFSSNPHGSKSR
jgi:hypothetical protein